VTTPAHIPRILVVGEINVDFVFEGCHALPAPGREVLADDFLMTPGSSSMICAMGLARLGNQVMFHGRVGADASGTFCLDALRDSGIDVSTVYPDPALRTGVTASLSSPQDRALITFAGAMSELRAEHIDDAWLKNADHLHVSSYYLQRGLRAGCRELFERATSIGLTTSLDPGFDPAQQWADDLLDTLNEVDVFFPNEQELIAITRCSDLHAALRFMQNGRTGTVVKRGRQGCTSLRDQQWLNVPAYPLDAVDTTGAGDSFDAGFLHAWLRRMPWIDCLRWGSACGSLSTRGVGGTTRQATESEVQILMAETP
jgi:sugar/nucleoside kinase (ribokinase family)